jgi:hypothetical protein
VASPPGFDTYRQLPSSGYSEQPDRNVLRGPAGYSSAVAVMVFLTGIPFLIYARRHQRGAEGPTPDWLRRSMRTAMVTNETTEMLRLPPLVVVQSSGTNDTTADRRIGGRGVGDRGVACDCQRD